MSMESDIIGPAVTPAITLLKMALMEDAGGFLGMAGETWAAFVMPSIVYKDGISQLHRRNSTVVSLLRDEAEPWSTAALRCECPPYAGLCAHQQLQPALAQSLQPGDEGVTALVAALRGVTHNVVGELAEGPVSRRVPERPHIAAIMGNPGRLSHAVVALVFAQCVPDSEPQAIKLTCCHASCRRVTEAFEPGGGASCSHAKQAADFIVQANIDPESFPSAPVAVADEAVWFDVISGEWCHSSRSRYKPRDHILYYTQKLMTSPLAHRFDEVLKKTSQLFGQAAMAPRTEVGVMSPPHAMLQPCRRLAMVVTALNISHVRVAGVEHRRAHVPPAQRPRPASRRAGHNGPVWCLMGGGATAAGGGVCIGRPCVVL